MAVVASSRGCSLATQCTWRAETAVSAGHHPRSRASSAAARNGERALPPGTVVSTRSCDEAMGAVSRSVERGGCRGQGYRGRRRSPRPARPAGGGRGRVTGRLPARAAICTVWNMIDVTRESTAPVDRLWSTISDVRALAAVAAHGGCRHPPRPGPARRGGRLLHGRAARAAEGRLDDHRLARRAARSPGSRPGPASARSAPTPCGRAPTARTTIELGITWSGPLAPLIRLAARAQEPRLRHPRGRGPRRHGQGGACAASDATDDAASA